MASSSLLDTRASVRNLRPAGQWQRPGSDTPTQTAVLVFFRHVVQQLLKSGHHERAGRRKVVIERLRASRDPMGYIGELLNQCVVEHRTDGLDVAIDVLSHFGSLGIEYARQFWKKDVARWEPAASPPRHHIHDDVWYVLLRAVGASALDPWQKIPMLSYCASAGTPSVREASIRALGDVGDPIAIGLIHRLGSSDSSAMVREAAQEVLDSLED
jgi:hypothetical protein